VDKEIEMKIKTSELTGAALDRAVAKCASVPVECLNDGITKCLLRKPSGRYAPSTDPSLAYPIIFREKISIEIQHDGLWLASIDGGTDAGVALYREHGPTPLIAAMRCYVASKLDDEVDIPEELA
jgi:hypothetical protein